MKVRLLIFLTSLVSLTSFGQAPIINNVQPSSTHPGNALLITGSGFNSSTTQMQVWFDQVKGTITAASEFSIEVTVPAQARMSNVEVINLTSGLSAKSLIKFVPFYSGTDFLTTELADPVLGSTTFSTGSEESFDVCSCDLDGDGKPDLASTKNSGTSTDIMLLRNTSTPGNASFTPSNFVTGTPTFNVACGDLNGDGKPDLVATRGGITRNEVFLLRNTSTSGTISFAPITKLFLDPGQFAFRIVIRDLNLDGKADIIVSNSLTSTTSTIYIFMNQSAAGTLSFNTTPTKVVVTGAGTTYGMDAQDLDGDLKPDIILNQFNASDIFILKNGSSVGQISFPTIIKVPLTGSLNHLTTADFNEDGKLDIAVTSSANDNKVFVLLNQSASGTISFPSSITLTGGDWPWGIDASDIDGDQDVDIITGNINNNNVANEIVVYRNNGNNTSLSFTRQSIQKGKRSRNLKVGDLDGDGKPDIAYTTVTSNSVDILRNKNCFTPVIIAPPATICAGQTIRIKSISNVAATFDWKKNGTSVKNGNDPFLDITSPGDYSVTATSEASPSCIVSSSSITVLLGTGTLPPNPVLSANTPLCSGQTLNLSVPAVSGATYQWTGPNSFTSILQSPGKTSITDDDAGFYTLKLSDGTCTVEATIKVDVANLANFFVSSSVASNAVCQGSSLNLIVNASSGHTYQWIKGVTDISLQTSPTLLVSQDGVYKVRVTNTTLNCSVETAATTVSVLTMPVSAFTPSTNSTCVNQSIAFTNQSTFDSRATVAYAWDFGDGTNSTLQSPTKSYATPATRNVQLTVSYTGVTGCSNVSTKSIAVATAQTPVITATVNTICAGEPSLLSVTGTFSAYAWTGPSTGASSTLNITQPGTYIVNTTETNGCTATAQIIIGAKALVTLSVTADGKPVASGADVLVLSGIPVQLVASGAVTYSWTPPDGLDNPSIANPKATPLTETTYTVTGAKVGSCNGIHSFNVKFDPAGNSFSPPNAFSPNGDTNNDFWVIQGSQNYMDCTISIFNKQGSNVFEQKGYTNNWDGTFEGKQLPQGTYYYVLTCPDEKPITGHILLAR